ncbi:MAG: serine/threonine protein kinase [Acidobacteriota bacterium]|nr:serine/threonine protein kinase [Acidobacteriota bacterium]
MKRWLPQLRRPRVRLGLLPRLLLALALVGLVPLVMVTADRQRVEESLREQVLRTHALAARNTADRVAGYLDLHRAVADALANNPQVYGDPSSPATGELLAGLLQGQETVYALALTNIEGEEFLRAQRREGAAAAEVALRAPTSREVTHLTADGGEWLRLDIPFADASGMVRLLATARPLAELLRPKEIGREAELVVADEGGRVVAGSLASLDELPPSLVAKAVSGRISGAAGEDEAVVGAFSPVPAVPWVVISTQPREVAEAVAARLRLRTRMAVAGAIFAVLVLSLAAWASVVRPIRDLVRAQRALVGLTTTPGGTEIEQLQESFSVLERRVKAREALDEVFLGRYQVLEVLGEGGMGTVFHGWDPTLQRPVALKTLRLTQEMEEETRRKRVSELLHEAVAAARINHPNVVAVYDVVEKDELAFIAMEMVEGRSLEDFLGFHRRLSPGQVVSVGRQIALALGAAHERGIVHHDVKPGNVLLGPDGEIKVVDFGISRFLSSLAEEKDKVFGTPGYLPPEALRGKGYTEAGDLFGLGAILYNCLTGLRAFPGTSVRDVVTRTLYDEPPPPSESAPGVPPELEAVILKLLAKDPEQRFSSAGRVARALAVLEEEVLSLESEGLQSGDDEGFSRGESRKESQKKERNSRDAADMGRSRLLSTVPFRAAPGRGR